MLNSMLPKEKVLLITIVPRMAAGMLTVLALLAGCSRPQAPTKEQAQAPAPFTSPAAQEVREVELSSAVVSILESAHRSGALIYRGNCAPERKIAEKYPLPEPVKLEPMADALGEISRRYPELKWREGGDGVRLRDSTVVGGLLKVRLKEFTIIEDREPEAALAALWRTPEVISYMAGHDVRFARQGTSARKRRKHAVVVVHMKNATVEEIVERIVASYPAAQSVAGGHKVWLYRECNSGAETLVEVKVL
jgi:hypothetical protein